MARQSNWFWIALAGAALGGAACSSGDSPQEISAAERGERVYKNVCIACHNADPSQPGSLGPAVAGASRELIEHRVIHGTYPEGYQRKQEGALMPQFPHLAGSIDDLAAYLAEGG